MTIKGCDCFTAVPNSTLISQAVHELLGFETLKIGHTRTHAHTHTHTHTRTHTSGRQLKIKFLDVLDYSEYSDTNISIYFFTKTHGENFMVYNFQIRILNRGQVEKLTSLTTRI